MYFLDNHWTTYTRWTNAREAVFTKQKNIISVVTALILFCLFRTQSRCVQRTRNVVCLCINNHQRAVEDKKLFSILLVLVRSCSLVVMVSKLKPEESTLQSRTLRNIDLYKRTTILEVHSLPPHSQFPLFNSNNQIRACKWEIVQLF